MKRSIKACAKCALLDATMEHGCPDNPDAPVAPGRVQTFFPLGQHIYQEGEELRGVYCMNGGQAALVKQDGNGTELIVAVISPGDVLGMPDMLEGSIYRTSAVALRDSMACFIPVEEMRALVRNNPAIMVRLLQQICQRIHTLEQKIEEHAGIDDEDSHAVV